MKVAGPPCLFASLTEAAFHGRYRLDRQHRPFHPSRNHTPRRAWRRALSWADARRGAYRPCHLSPASSPRWRSVRGLPSRRSAGRSSPPRSGTRSRDKFGAAAPRSTARSSPRSLAMLIAVPVGIGIAIFLTELCPQLAASPHRHRHRAARGNSEHHLWHLGPVCLRPLVPGERAAANHRRHR